MSIDDLSRDNIIMALLRNNMRLHPSLIEEYGRRFRFHPKIKGRWVDIYDKFNMKALRSVYSCFIEGVVDQSGRNLEYRIGQWISRRNKSIKQLAFKKKLSFGEIDVIGYDDNQHIISIAECKARKGKASKEDIDPWLKNVELLHQYSEGSLTTAYFANISGYTDGIKNRILEHPNIDKNGFFKMTKKWRAFTNGYVLARETLGVDISLCEERAGVIKKIFP